MTTPLSNCPAGRPRSAAPGLPQARGLLIRRPSTPNTLKSLVNLFANTTPKPTDSSKFERPVASRAVEVPAFSDGAPHAETIAYMRMLVSAVPLSRSTLRPQSAKGETVAPQPACQSTLLQTGLHSTVFDADAPTSTNVPSSRPPSASSAPTPAVPVLAPSSALWEPALVKPHQVRLHHGRPLSAASCERLRPSSALRRPMSCKAALVGGDVERLRGSSTAIHGGNHPKADVLTGCVVLRSPTHRALLDVGCRKPERFPEITSALSRLLAAMIHEDASATHASKKPSRNGGIFPLPNTSPWSMISMTFSIVRERFLFHIDAPASKIVGCRVFWSMLSVLNGHAACPCAATAATLSSLFDGATTVVDDMEGVPLQEADRHDDDSDGDIVVVVPLDGPAEGGPAEEPAASVTSSSESKENAVGMPEITKMGEESVCATEAQELQVKETRASPASLLSFSSILGEGDGSANPLMPLASLHAEAVANFSSRRCQASFRGTGTSPSKRDFSGRRDISPPREHTVASEQPTPAQQQPLGRRISIFLDHSLVGQAASVLRRMSSGASLLQDKASASDGCQQSPVSEDRNHLLSAVASSCASWSPSRSAKSVAVIIAVSTFRSVDIPPCAQIHTDANDIASLLRDECGFDDVILMSSESPSSESFTPTMANIRRVNETILNKYVADTDAEPLVTYVVLSRGGICDPGSISGVSSKSSRLVPFPSASYQGVVAKEPTHAVKVALLEGAEPTALRSLDLVTPEMFYDMLRFNGRTIQPLVIFDVWPCRLGESWTRTGSAMCGFASWTVPDCPESNFVSVSRSGVGGVCSYYFRKLLVGGVARSLAKRFRRSDGIAKARYGALLARAASSNYDVSVLQAFHYLVPRLLRRSCSVNYDASSLLEETAKYATNEVLEESSQSILGKTFRGKLQSRFFFRLNRFASAVRTSTDHNDPVKRLVEYTLGSRVGSRDSPRVMYDCDVEVSLTHSGRVAHRHLTESTWLNDALLRWKARMSTSLRSLLLRRRAPAQQKDDRDSPSGGRARVWACSFAEHEVWEFRCRQEVSATDTAHALCNRFLVDLLHAGEVVVTTEVSQHEGTVTLKMLQRNDGLRQRLMERIAQLAGKGINLLRNDLSRSSWADAAKTLEDSIARITTRVRFSLALSTWEAQKVDLAGRMQAFKSIGTVHRLGLAYDSNTVESAVSEGEYAAAFRIQAMWARVIPLRTVFQSIRRLVADQEPASRVAVSEAEYTTRATVLHYSLFATLLNGIGAWEQRCRLQIQCSAASECTSGRLGELAEVSYQLEESHHRRALRIHEALTVQCDCLEPFERRWIEFEWASPWVPKWRLAPSTAPVHKFHMLYWIATKESHDRTELRRAEIRGRIVIWDLTGDFLKDAGVRYEDFVERVPDNPFAAC